MKISLKYLVGLVLVFPFLGGCGKQGAFDRVDLSSLEQGFESQQTIDDVTIAVKQLTPKDRDYVFGRKNLTFSPVLVTIENKGKGDLFFDARRGGFHLAKVEIKGKLVWGATLIGGGLAYASGTMVPIGAICGIILSSAGDFWVGVSIAMVPIVGLCGGIALCTYAFRRKKSEKFNLLCKPSYVIKKNSKESILLFFEKNKVPNLLPLTLEVQSEPAQILNFELSTNRALRSNAYIYKTV